MPQDIHCTHLYKSYQDHPSLVDLSLTLRQGSVTGILGVNGSGKSTLIKCILGLIKPSSGEILIPDHNVVGYLPELAQLPSSISAFQIISFAAQLRGTERIAERIDIPSVLAQVHLQETYWHKPLRTFSKGMRQRIALAYAITGDPEWLILDEPMSGLDAMGRKQFLDILLAMNQQNTGILVCSHIVPDLVRLCDEILLIKAGKIIETVNIVDHSMDEAIALENRLIQTSDHSYA